MTTHKISVSFDDATLAALHRGARGEHRSVSNYLAALVLRAEGIDRRQRPDEAAWRSGVEAMRNLILAGLDDPRGPGGAPNAEAMRRWVGGLSPLPEVSDV